MREIQVDDGVFSALEAQATGFGQAPNDVLRRLLRLPAGVVSPGIQPVKDDPITLLIRGPAFKALRTDEDKYMAMLSTLYASHSADFKLLETYGRGRRLYFATSAQAIKNKAAYAGVKPIPATPYFAMTTLDNAKKREILRHAMTRFDYSAEAIERAVNTIPSVLRRT